MANRDFNPGQGFSAPADVLRWDNEEQYWRNVWHLRPYVVADRGFDFYRGGYRYGFEAALRNRGRRWDDVESELQRDWDDYEYRGTSRWEHVKDAVRDGWDRVMHR